MLFLMQLQTSKSQIHIIGIDIRIQLRLPIIMGQKGKSTLKRKHGVEDLTFEIHNFESKIVF